MPGHVRDVQRYYDVADAVVIPSWSEGSPNVLLESMAAGVPVVATSVGGIPEIVRAVYTDVSPKAHAMAERAVIAHLEKLEADDLIVRSSEDIYRPTSKND